MKNRAILIIFMSIFVSIFLSLNLISAINLDVSSKPVSNLVITNLNKPAVFDLIIRNLEDTSDFEIYSLVGVDISPETPTTISSGETKTIRIEITPQASVAAKKGSFTFEYRIKNSENEIQKQALTINIVDLGGAFAITPENINPQSQEIQISIKNKADIDFLELKIQMDSAFFDFEETLSIKSQETNEFIIEIDQEKLKKLDAGPYLLNTRFETQGKSSEVESIIKFLEYEDIEKSETTEGFIIKRREITYQNLGNLRKTVEVKAEKNLISYLFTTVNVIPTRTEITGFKKHYFWEKELIPNEELKIIIKTNWLYPIIVILLVIGLFILIKRNIETNLILRKEVSFVKTKGGEFALKVRVRAKAKKFIERINIIDKLPPLVKLYERFGAISPDKIDLDNRRLEWDIEQLNKGEERIFSYIIYSKVGVIGRFELPEARAVYEKEGKVKRTESNRSFFINELKG